MCFVVAILKIVLCTRSETSCAWVYKVKIFGNMISCHFSKFSLILDHHTIRFIPIKCNCFQNGL